VDEQSATTGDTGAPAPSLATTCVVDEQWVGRVAVVSVSGEIDMLTAPQLEQGIRSALAQEPAGLVVDFTNVEFLASAGMGVLVAVHDEVAPDVRFCVVAEGPATSRPLKLVGIADLIKLYATREEALSALSA
jgi:anti-anti-sigma factor